MSGYRLIGVALALFATLCATGCQNDLAADVVAHFWAKRGYMVVIEGTRGRFNPG